MIRKEQERKSVLTQCRDSDVITKVFSDSMAAYFEEQLQQYLSMSEITELYLYNVPPVVCWYEGMISTEDLIDMYGIKKENVFENEAMLGVPVLALP